MSCKMGKNESKWFLLTFFQYAAGVALLLWVVHVARIGPDGLTTLHDLDAIGFIFGCILIVTGWLSEGVMRMYNEKEGNGVYSKYGL